MKAAIIFPLVFLAGCTAATKEDAAKTETAEQAAIQMNAAQKAYAAANAKMHAGMNNIPQDADEAFIIGMIPHHQGAVDMANIVLEHGKDAETRALAETIIKAQKTEIAQMEAWLKKRGIDPAQEGGAHVDHSAAAH